MIALALCRQTPFETSTKGVNVEQTKTGKLFSISDIDCGCATEGGCAAQRLNLNLFDLRRATCLMDLLKLSPKVFAFSVSN